MTMDEIGHAVRQAGGLETQAGLTGERTAELLRKIQDLRVGVIGDVCLDAYWEADMTRSELSRETPHHPLPVIAERYSPGAAGNVAANVRALGCAEAFVCSAIGRDWRGALLKEQFDMRRIDTSYLLTAEDWTTPAYCKPIRIGVQGSRQEDPRLDFRNYRPLSAASAQHLAAGLDAMAERCDAILVTDQLPNGVVGDEIRRKLCAWGQAGKIVVVDSRDNIGAYRGVIVKPNEVEAGKWLSRSEAAPTGHVGRGSDAETGHVGRGSDAKTGHVGRGSDAATGHMGRESDAETGHVGRGSDAETGHVGRGSDAPTGHAGRGSDAPTGHAGRGSDAPAAASPSDDVAHPDFLPYWADAAAKLAELTASVCCLTLGPVGAVWADRERRVFVPARTVAPPVDIVGAGDAYASALGCALAVGADGAEALAFAHLASAIVIRKIGTTGTASPQEMLEERERGR